ncbi:MAG: type II toxin-antitoxin system prevent-host-death family antitoxin [Treponema sp.]|jgi:prevent-host-death family protein|nr:type II toxin-antitoxin system prevent-host-death family antitoxin [Treponema sp.]
MTIGAFEAKTHFSQIIANVEKGQDYIITKRGKPVAKITSVPEETRTFGEAILEMREYMRRHWKGDEPFDIREAIEEGRR